jgi:hypothetical protein
VLYRAVVRLTGRDSAPLLVALSVWPSVLFWSSILGKDPLVLFGIAVYCYGVLAWYSSRHSALLLVAILGVLLASTVRLWLAPILVAPLGFLVARTFRSPVARWGTLAGAAVGAGMLLFFFRTQLLVELVSELLVNVDTVARGWAEGGSGQQIAGDLTNPRALIAFLPRGMFTALFRPLPGEVNNVFGALAGLESLVLVGLLGIAVARTRWRELGDPLVQWALLVILAWSSVYSVLSYQNLGTAVRFRLQILPVLLGLLAFLARRRSVATS